MRNFKFIIPLMLLMVSGCNNFKYSFRKEVKTGLISLNEVKHYIWFKKEYSNYNFKANTEDSLIDLRNFKITIIGGEWCSDTKMYLPRFIKILETLKFKEENLQIIFVDATKKKPVGLDFYENLKVKFVPTFIVYNEEGKEIGRIVESPKKTLEEDLIKIINQQ